MAQGQPAACHLQVAGSSTKVNKHTGYRCHKQAQHACLTYMVAWSLVLSVLLHHHASMILVDSIIGPRPLPRLCQPHAAALTSAVMENQHSQSQPGWEGLAQQQPTGRLSPLPSLCKGRLYFPVVSPGGGIMPGGPLTLGMRCTAMGPGIG